MVQDEDKARQRELAYHEQLYSGFAQSHFARAAVRELRRHMVSRITSLLATGSTSLVLSLGCGIGDTELLLAPHVGRVVGMDLSPSGVRQANADAARLGIGNAEFVQAAFQDTLDLPPADGVIAIFFLHHVASALAASVSIENTTNPSNPNFQVGNSFLVTITGAAPNATVKNCATQNGNSAGCTGYGSTNGSGGFTLPGTMSSASFEGKWVENWSVGGVAVPPTLTFFVGSATPPQIYGPNSSCSGSGTTSIAFWYLNGQPSIDGYAVSWQACLKANTADSSPTITWSTDAPSLIGVTPNSGGAMLTSTGASPPGYPPEYSHVTVTVDGVASSPFPVFVNTPYTLRQTNNGAYCSDGGCTCWYGTSHPWQGFVQTYTYTPLDLFKLRDRADTYLGDLRTPAVCQRRIHLLGISNAD